MDSHSVFVALSLVEPIENLGRKSTVRRSSSTGSPLKADPKEVRPEGEWYLWWGLAVLSVLVLGYCFGDSLTVLVRKWQSEEYSHGFIIPVVSLFFAWRTRDELMAMRPQANWTGFLVVLAGLALYLLGEYGNTFSFKHFLLRSAVRRSAVDLIRVGRRHHSPIRHQCLPGWQHYRSRNLQAPGGGSVQRIAVSVADAELWIHLCLFDPARALAKVCHFLFDHSTDYLHEQCAHSRGGHSG